MTRDAIPATPGGRLRWLRELRGETKADVGRAVGCSGQQIGRYERDENQPGGIILLRLSQHFGVSTAFLQCLTDDPHRNSYLPPEWEALAKRIMEDGWTPKDVETAMEMLRIYRMGTGCIKNRED